MVVKSYEAINRLRQAAQAANMPIPSMLSYTLIQVSGGLLLVGCMLFTNLLLICSTQSIDAHSLALDLGPVDFTSAVASSFSPTLGTKNESEECELA